MKRSMRDRQWREKKAQLNVLKMQAHKNKKKKKSFNKRARRK
jgi:hypothetical protein